MERFSIDHVLLKEYGHNSRVSLELWSTNCRKKPPKSTPDRIWTKNTSREKLVLTYHETFVLEKNYAAEPEIETGTS